jgi:hypothetical protein
METHLIKSFLNPLFYCASSISISVLLTSSLLAQTTQNPSTIKSPSEAIAGSVNQPIQNNLPKPIQTSESTDLKKPITPSEPSNSTESTKPITPSEPSNSTESTKPLSPIEPSNSPIEPSNSTDLTKPIPPSDTPQPTNTTAPPK